MKLKKPNCDKCDHRMTLLTCSGYNTFNGPIYSWLWVCRNCDEKEQTWII